MRVQAGIEAVGGVLQHKQAHRIDLDPGKSEKYLLTIPGSRTFH